jgi:hypothetical protein
MLSKGNYLPLKYSVMWYECTPFPLPFTPLTLHPGISKTFKTTIDPGLNSRSSLCPSRSMMGGNPYIATTLYWCSFVVDQYRGVTMRRTLATMCNAGLISHPIDFANMPSGTPPSHLLNPNQRIELNVLLVFVAIMLIETRASDCDQT